MAKIQKTATNGEDGRPRELSILLVCVSNGIVILENGLAVYLNLLRSLNLLKSLHRHLPEDISILAISLGRNEKIYPICP